MPEAAVVRRYKKAIAKTDPKTRQLQPWEFAFAEWYANAFKRPSRAEQYAQAKILAPEAFDPGPVYIESLKKTPAWHSYVRDIKRDALSAARKKLVGNYGTAVTAHFEGLELARDAEDYKAIPAFTNPILDRIISKTNSADIAPVAVQINISTARQELLETEPLEVEYEIIDDGTDTDNS